MCTTHFPYVDDDTFLTIFGICTASTGYWVRNGLEVKGSIMFAGEAEIIIGFWVDYLAMIGDNYSIGIN